MDMRTNDNNDLAAPGGRTWGFLRDEDGWTLLGGPAFLPPGPPHTMAHHVVHHDARSTGTYDEILAALGAQHYVDHHQGVVEDRQAFRRRLAHVIREHADDLDQSPPGFSSEDFSDGIPEDVHALWSTAGLKAVFDVQPYNTDPTTNPMVVYNQRVMYHETLVARLYRGWHAARARWSDPTFAHQLFLTIETALDPEAPVGTRVNIAQTPQGLFTVETVPGLKPVLQLHDQESGSATATA